MKVYLDKDIDLSVLIDKKIGFIGYGSQGRAHALNLKDSGIKDISVALYEGSKTIEIAKNDGFKVSSIQDVSAYADILVMALPDERQSEVYDEFIAPNIKDGAALCFIHGLNIHFGLIKPKPTIDIFMVAPKGPGVAVRSEYLEGRGTLCLFAVDSNVSGRAKELALAYAKGLGCGKTAIIETIFKDETIGDLFGEQAILCGGLVGLIRSSFDVLVEGGVAPHIAYLECVHEVKLIADLIYKCGIADMNRRISNTAEWGEYVSGCRVIDDKVIENMRDILSDIKNGKFVNNWISEYKNGLPNLKKIRELNEQQDVEKVGREIRNFMPWLKG